MEKGILIPFALLVFLPSSFEAWGFKNLFKYFFIYFTVIIFSDWYKA